MDRKGHGPIDFVSKGFGIVLGFFLVRLASDGVALSQGTAIFLGITLILLSIAAFFG
jgi:hypothetical protein